MGDNLQAVTQYAILATDVTTLKRHLIGLLKMLMRIEGETVLVIRVD
jgi:hypothetical protein